MIISRPNVSSQIDADRRSSDEVSSKFVARLSLSIRHVQICLGLAGVAAAGVIAPLTGACGQAGSTRPQHSVDPAIVKRVVEDRAAKGFAGTVVVDQAGRLLYQGAFGVANDKTREPVTLDTVFDIGSITKQLTGAAIIRLVQDGKLSLDQPLNKFFPDVPSEKASITVGQLLHQRSGLPDHHARDRDILTREQALKKIFEWKLAFAPGTDVLYSNSGYTVLAAIIEKASGQSYLEYVGQLLRSAGAKRTADYSDPMFDHMKVATGYLGGDDQGSPASWVGPSWSTMGNGEFLSTAEDLRVWTRALMHGHIVDKDQLPNMWSRYRDSKLGRSLSPAGGGAGGNATIAYYPDLDLTVVVMSNRIGWTQKDGKVVEMDLPAEQLRDDLEQALADAAGHQPSGPTG